MDREIEKESKREEVESLKRDSPNKTFLNRIPTQKRRINWLIWIIPFLSGIISLSIVLKYYSKEGLLIEVSFKNVNGFKPGKTAVKYRGVKVGVVEKITLDRENLNRFIVKVRIYPQYSYLIKQGSQFWKAMVQISPDRISNLDTLLKGSYIAILPPATSREKLERLPTQFYFKGMEHPPGEEGIKIGLISNRGELGKGAGIFYKGFLIGKIYGKRLLPSGKVHYTALIFKPFTYLLTKNIKFYRMSPVEFKASLQRVEIKIGSIRVLLSGGVGVYVGEGKGDKNRNYPLYENREDIRYALKPIKLVTTSRLPLSLLVYNDIVAGKVIDSQYDLHRNRRILKVKLQKEFYSLLYNSPIFYIDRPTLSLSSLNLKKLITGPFIRMEITGKTAPIRESYPLSPLPPAQEGYRLEFTLSEGTPPKEGAPILYRRFKVGEVERVKLIGKKFNITAKIYQKYLTLINNSTFFYLITPFRFTASWEKGISGKIGPISSLLTGAIGFITPSRDKLTLHRFKLYKSEMEIHSRLKGKKGVIIKLITHRLEGIKVGTPIYYHSFPIGEVLGYQLGKGFLKNLTGRGKRNSIDKDTISAVKTDEVEIIGYIYPKFKALLSASPIFYLKKGVQLKVGVSGLELKTAPLATLLSGAILMELEKPVGKGIKKVSSRNGKRKGKNKKGTGKKFFPPVYPLYTYQEFQKLHTFTIQLRMEQNPGIKVGTPLQLKGVQIGKVTALQLEAGSGIVVADITIPNRFKPYFGQNAQLYLHQFQASLDGVRNVGALITGGVLELVPDSSHSFKKYYRLSGINPPPTFGKPGIRVKLITDGSKPIGIGAPVYYRYIPVGKVEQVELNPKGGVVTTLFFPTKYRYLVRVGDKFRYFYPFKLESHFLNFKVEVGTLPVILRGGIELKEVNFSTPLAPSNFSFFIQDQ